jgi:hypothetical protein
LDIVDGRSGPVFAEAMVASPSLLKLRRGKQARDDEGGDASRNLDPGSLPGMTNHDFAEKDGVGREGFGYVRPRRLDQARPRYS